MRERGAVRDFETRMRKRSGEIIEVQFSAEVMENGGEACLLVSVADVSGSREAERRARFLATRDALTGLPNRVAALDRLQHGMERATAAGKFAGRRAPRHRPVQVGERVHGPMRRGTR